MKVEIWQVAVAAVAFLFTVAGVVSGLVVWLVKRYLGTLAKGHSTLFDTTNEHDDRIHALEKFALLSDPNKATMFIATRNVAKRDFDKTVILEARPK